METVKCPQCGSGEKVVSIVYGSPVEIVEAIQSAEWALGGCAIFLRLPDAYCKGCDYESRKSEPESEGGKRSVQQPTGQVYPRGRPGPL